MYGAPFGTFPRKRRGIRWWQIPLLLVTFPISLAIVCFGWLRSLRFWKIALGFMVVWVVYGQVVVMIDADSGAWGGNAPDHGVSGDNLKRMMRSPANEGPYIASNPSGWCDPGRALRHTFGHNPFAGPWLFVLGCETVIGREMLTRSGLRAQSHWLVYEYDWVYIDYRVDGQITSNYLLLGVLAPVEAVVVLPWLICYAAIEAVRHVHVSWR